jgi:hypothetical protein
MHGEIVCPYCGFNVKASDGDKRSTRRSVVRRGCVLERGDVRGAGETVDLSTSGVGIRTEADLVIREQDVLKVLIEELEIDSSAEVVWIRKTNGISIAGLRFLDSVHFTAT